MLHVGSRKNVEIRCLIFILSKKADFFHVSVATLRTYDSASLFAYLLLLYRYIMFATLMRWLFLKLLSYVIHASSADVAFCGGQVQKFRGAKMHVQIQCVISKFYFFCLQ